MNEGGTQVHSVHVRLDHACYMIESNPIKKSVHICGLKKLSLALDGLQYQLMIENYGLCVA